MHVSTDNICSHLQHAGRLSFGHNHPLTEIDITGHALGPTSTVEVHGPANHTVFNLQGVDTSDHLPNARLIVDDPAAFRGEIVLGPDAEVTFDVHATSYSFDMAHDLLRLYQGDTVVGSFDVHFGAPTRGIEAISSATSTSITSARFPNGAFVDAIGVHT